MTTQDRLTVEPTPVPVIETDFNQEPLSTDDIVFDSPSDQQIDWDFSMVVLDDSNYFTQSELQSLRSMVRVELNQLNQQIAELQKLQSFFYRTSDKIRANEPHIAKAFECLNVARNSLRSEKARLRKLEGIQRKLRLQIACG